MVDQSDPPSVFAFRTLPDATKLRQYYVGKNLQEINGPAIVLDKAILKTNCDRMLDTANKLGLGFRAHVKTHKTLEATALQVGEDAKHIKIIVSTVAEAEHLLPFFQECKSQGKTVNILYGIPLSTSSVPRLRRIRDILGSDSVSFLVDHPSQLQNIINGTLGSNEVTSVFIKIDSGYQRAGVQPQFTQYLDLLNAIKESEQAVKVAGLYSYHNGGYAANSPKEALEYLIKEIEATAEAAERAKKLGVAGDNITISVGTTPSSSSARLFLQDSPSIQKIRKIVDGLKQHYELEIHAGVYPFLDLQQLATFDHSAQVDKDTSISAHDIGIRVLAEVLSIYPERDQLEALVGAGSLALGREPCKSYAGWGIVAPSPWARGTLTTTYNWNEKVGWKVGRISQEHGILTWEGKRNDKATLRVGENVMIWPNHACIAGAGFDWYLIVDSQDGEGGTQVKDVWVRCRGW